MIKLYHILPELKARPSGYKFVKGSYTPSSEEELRELESLHSLEVTGNLYLDYKSITKLPDNLKVGDDLDLYYSQITELPNNLQVGGDLYLNGTPLVKKYTNRQIRRMILKQGGSIGGRVYRGYD